MLQNRFPDGIIKGYVFKEAKHYRGSLRRGKVVEEHPTSKRIVVETLRREKAFLQAIGLKLSMGRRTSPWSMSSLSVPVGIENAHCCAA